jgi:hypothetical protein
MTPFERAARAIAYTIIGYYPVDGEEVFYDAAFFDAEDFEDIARAVLEAIRKPNEDMFHAVDDGCGPSTEYLTKIWQAMIDAALGE